MRAWLVLPLLLLAARPAEADRLRCQLVVIDALSRPIVGATVTCGGVKATWEPASKQYISDGDAAPGPNVEVRIRRRGFLPTVTSLPRPATGVVSSLVWGRRRGEPVLRRSGQDIPFIAEPDRLLITLARYDRAAGRQRSRAEVLADLAPLFTRLGLVESTSRARPRPAGGFGFARCGNPDDEVVLARADGTPFAPAAVDALAALRSEPWIRTAGPLIRQSPTSDGELALGHVITVHTAPAPTAAPLAEFAARHHATWELRDRTMTLPPTIGLAAADVLNELLATIPEVSAELELLGPKVCID